MIKRVIVAAAVAAALSPAAWAGPCQTGTLDTYDASGFSCTIGDSTFSNFRWQTDVYASDVYGTANQPGDITVTPQDGTDGVGFAFSNLGLSFIGSGSLRASDVYFDVSSTSPITGAFLGIGTHTYSGPGGEAYGDFEDLYGTIFSLTVSDPGNGSLTRTPYRLTDSAGFAGVSSMSLASGVGAIVNGFGGGNATVDGYKVLLSMSSSTGTPVPEPGSLALLATGILGLGFAGWRRRVR